MIYLYIFLAALLSTCITRYIIYLYLRIRTRYAESRALLAKWIIHLVDTSMVVIFLFAFWLPVFIKFSELKQGGDVRLVLAYGSLFFIFLWLLLLIFPTNSSVQPSIKEYSSGNPSLLPPLHLRIILTIFFIVTAITIKWCVRAGK
jgi:hypothetical protein